ncbi:MAG: histidine phosphatase family protein [Ilumatobacteraceae bacterium]|nr:histidine phosphatase family protein [Ilumatobacteraceae bacterium]
MLILVRHGRTIANAQALLQGHVNHPLDEVGIDQARRVARVLNDLYPEARVVSSPLLRAHQTAEAISAAVTIDDRFIELNYGDFDELALTDVSPDIWDQWRSDEHFRPPHGESLHELDIRVHEALRDLSAEARSQDVIVVTHVSPIKSAVTWALGGDASMTWRCALDRASITRLTIGPRGASLAGFNDTAHLLEK